MYADNIYLVKRYKDLRHKNGESLYGSALPADSMFRVNRTSGSIMRNVLLLTEISGQIEAID